MKPSEAKTSDLALVGTYQEPLVEVPDASTINVSIYDVLVTRFWDEPQIFPIGPS
jgi:hypothetical protein